MTIVSFLKAIRIIAITNIILFFSFGNFVSGQEKQPVEGEGEFENQICQLIITGNNERIESLLIANRLEVKAFVLDMLNKCTLQANSGTADNTENCLACASAIANRFQQLFNEKSLVNIVNSHKSRSLEENKQKVIADSLCKIGGVLRTDPDAHEEALRHYQEALDIYKLIDDEYGKAVAYGGIGAVYWYYNVDSCRINYERALDLRIKLDDKSLIGDSYNGLGLVHSFQQNNFDIGIDYFEKALEIRKETGESEKFRSSQKYKAYAYSILGSNHRYMGEYDLALEIYNKSLNIYSELNDSIYIGEMLTQIGYIYNLMGDYTKAIMTYREALNIIVPDDIRGLAGVYNNLGITYQNAKKFDSAIDYYSKGLEYFKALDDEVNTLITLNNIGTIYFDRKDFSLAEEVLFRGLEMSRSASDSLMLIHFIVNLANTQNKLGKLEEAHSYYMNALELSSAKSFPEISWKCLVGLAENHKLRGDIKKAIEYNEEAFQVIEQMRTGMDSDEYRAKYLAKERYVFEDVINMLGEQHIKEPESGFDIKAFEFAEQCKARALLDLLSESVVTDRGHTEVKNNSINSQNKLIDIEDFQESCLDNNTLLLEYSLGDENSWLWAINNKERRLFKIPGRDKLEEEVEILRFALQNPDEDRFESFAESSYRMYSQILDPAGSLITNGTRIIIVPDGILNYLPFEALLSSNPRGGLSGTFSDLPFLIRANPVSYAQSASVFNNILNNNEKGINTYSNDLVAFGDPVYETKNSQNVDGLQRLIYSGRELDLISKYFRGKRSKLFLREAATEDAIKQKGDLLDSRYLHFATHGLIDEVNPQASSLVLAMDGDQAEDGFLKTSEIFKLNTSAELVVLSACQTGLGKLVRGEGMVGLSRAFMYAGAPSVLVSLWNVSDESTSVLMSEFYRNLVKKGYSKSDAIQRAQVSMIQGEKYAHPFYWAAFILLGDWR